LLGKTANSFAELNTIIRIFKMENKIPSSVFKQDVRWGGFKYDNVDKHCGNQSSTSKIKDNQQSDPKTFEMDAVHERIFNERVPCTNHLQNFILV